MGFEPAGIQIASLAAIAAVARTCPHASPPLSAQARQYVRARRAHAARAVTRAALFATSLREREAAGAVGAGFSADGALELRAFLQQTLPDFMVPTAFVTLPAMPLNASGKVDRLVLPAPEGSGRPEGGEAWAEPGSDLEKTLAEVFCEVLGRDRVGRNDNFFDLGGHSLLLIRAAGALEGRIGRKVEVLELFQYPSIALLARYLEGEAAALPSQDELSQKVEERRRGQSRRRELRKRNS